MRTLTEYLNAIYGDTLATGVSDPNGELTDVVGAWLSQDEVRDLLQAAWDPALQIKRFDLGISYPMTDPDTGAEIRSRDLMVEASVRGELHGMAITVNPDREVDDALWTALEIGLRGRLIDRALGR